MNELAVPRDEAPPGEELLTIDEAARFLDISKTTLYRLLGQGDLKGVKVSRQWRFRRPDLAAYLERGPVAAAAAPRADLDAALDFFAEELRSAGVAGADVNLPDDASAEQKTVALAQRLVLLAIVSQASDIHLEAMGESLRLRCRIDGVLQEIRRMPMSLHESLIACFKTMADMNLTERRVTQDGRAQISREGKEYDLRMSVLPTLYGENIVIRILDRSSVRIGLSDLALDPQDLDAIRHWIHRSAGLVIAAGPTGAGKTTLLYSCLQEINSVQKKILTMEDPVEYVIPGITQTPVQKRVGMTFSAGMRSFLRQDPDVIFCGETRDLETAQIAVEASLTGHLVLTTLHTEDAPTALVRLADMGVERYLVAATVNGVVALRLARRLCEYCKTPADPGEIAPTLEKVRPLAQRGGYRIPDDAIFYDVVGCPQCRRTGYRGRVGLFEVLSCTPRTAEQLLRCNGREEMTDLAVTFGMKTLLADGVRKAVAGETTLDEVLRATAVWL